MNRCGLVSLVGAGPGDAELLTIKAAKAIARADILLVDDLVQEDVLAHARPDARIVYVGKRGGCASTPQSFICKLLVAEAKRGCAVVRLKGGDPAIFSRAAEEIAALVDAGIAYEIIPGITAASAAAASLGLPLTSRDAGHGVAFITGHPANDEEPVRWRALLDANITLAIYMGVSRAEEISDALRSAGAPDNLPCAIVSRTGSLAETHLIGTLKQLPDLVASRHVVSPSIILLGNAISAKGNARAVLNGEPANPAFELSAKFAP